MSKKEEGLQRLEQRFGQYVLATQEAREKRKQVEKREETTHQQAKKRYDKWIQLHQKKALRSARMIWSWYREFIDTPLFKKIVLTLKESGKNEIRISGAIECSIPSDRSLYNTTEEQLLGIDCSGQLFVHNCGKYGKSYLIHDQDDLLEEVALPILIEIADTVRDETIWEFVNF